MHTTADATLTSLLNERSVLLADGAMGTQLFALGLDSGDPPERWNAEETERVLSVHRSYVDAGSDILLTNSFGGTRYRLKLHDLQDRAIELNREAARLGRLAADEVERPVLVAGSMGPTGELLVPMGTMTPEACQAAYAEQATGLAEGGVDLIWVETVSDLGEVEAAVLGAQQVTDLPIAVTMSFDTAGRTMMGVTGVDAVTKLAELGVAAIGANCGNNLADTEAALAQMASLNLGIPLISKANAGIPEWKGDGLVYSGTPEVMGAHAHRLREAGVSIIGACCGSSPEHLSLMHRVLSGDTPVPDVEVPVASATAAGEAREPRRRRRRG